MKLNYKVISVFIGIGYSIIGILVLLHKRFFINLSPFNAYLLGGLFILYGFFRFYRSLKYIFNKNE